MTSQAPPLRFLQLVRVLCEHEVDFVVIGGFAVILHGVPRATKDVDVVPAPGEENLGRLWRALEDLGAEPQGLDDFRPEEMPVAWSLAGLVEGQGNWILHTRLGRIDVMQWVKGVEGYEDLRRNAVTERLEEVGCSILFAGLNDLIRMKEEAGRDQDLIDITALRMAHGLEE